MDDLKAKNKSLSENQLLYVQEQLKQSINKLTDQNQSLKQKNEEEQMRVAESKVQIHKLNTQI